MEPVKKEAGKMWVYICLEPGCYTVGFYDPKGFWVAESDHDSSDEAAERVHYLNGGVGGEIPQEASGDRSGAVEWW